MGKNNKKFTYEEVKQEFYNKGYMLISDKYINCETKLQFVCNKHQDKAIQEIDFNHLHQRNQGCKYCRLDKIKENSIKGWLTKKNYDYVDYYTKNDKTIVKYICKSHAKNGTQEISFRSLQAGHGCKFCAKEKMKSIPKFNRTKEDEILKFFKTLENIEYYGHYFKKGRLRVKYKCTKHIDKILEMDFNNFRRSKYYCEDCRHESRIKQTFIEDIYKLNHYIEILSEYKGNEIPVNCRCKIHNEIWEVTPCSLLAHPTCPKCRKAISLSEKTLAEILDDFKYKYITQKKFSECKDKRALPFDFYLYDFNILIEFQGEQHYAPIKRSNLTKEETLKKYSILQYHDNIKKEFCKKNKIMLICIPYWERENMECYLWDQLVKCGAIEEVKTA